MHATVAEEADEMQLALAAALHGLLEERDLVELLVGDEEINAGDVHVYDAAGADVEVAHFAVAHLAFRKADVRARSMDQRIRKFLEQRVISRLARKGDGVAFGFSAESPSVEHSKNNWFRTFGHSLQITQSSSPAQSWCYARANSRRAASRRSTSSAVL